MTQENEPTLQRQAEAAEQGRHAALAGDPFLRNPYDRSREPALWEAWRKGYLVMLDHLGGAPL